MSFNLKQETWERLSLAAVANSFVLAQQIWPRHHLSRTADDKTQLEMIVALPPGCTASSQLPPAHSLLLGKEAMKEADFSSRTERGGNDGKTHRLAGKKPQEGMQHHPSKARSHSQCWQGAGEEGLSYGTSMQVSTSIINIPYFGKLLPASRHTDS